MSQKNTTRIKCCKGGEEKRLWHWSQRCCKEKRLCDMIAVASVRKGVIMYKKNEKDFASKLTRVFFPDFFFAYACTHDDNLRMTPLLFNSSCVKCCSGKRVVTVLRQLGGKLFRGVKMGGLSEKPTGSDQICERFWQKRCCCYAYSAHWIWAKRCQSTLCQKKSSVLQK